MGNCKAKLIGRIITCILPLDAVADPNLAEDERREKLKKCRDTVDGLCKGYDDGTVDKHYDVKQTLVKRSVAEGGDIPIIVHVPKKNVDPDLVVLHFHGGGMTVGSEKDQPGIDLFTTLAEAMGGACCFISVGYRLAPDAQFPAAIDDALAVYKALSLPDLSGLLGRAPKRVGMHGVSAGGLVASHAAVTLAQEGQSVDILSLFSPMTDPNMKGPAYKEFGHLGSCPEKWLKWSWRVFLTDDITGKTDPKAAELDKVNLKKLPWGHLKTTRACVASATLDCMVDDHTELGKIMGELGVNVERISANGLHAAAELMDENSKKKIINFWKGVVENPGAAPAPAASSDEGIKAPLNA